MTWISCKVCLRHKRCVDQTVLDYGTENYTVLPWYSCYPYCG